MATSKGVETETVTIGNARHRTGLSALAYKFLEVLLAHQREHRLPGDSYEPGKIDLRLISYTHLCRIARAGDPHNVAATINPALDEIHRWCALNRWPPVDALVVEASSRRP